MWWTHAMRYFMSFVILLMWLWTITMTTAIETTSEPLVEGVSALRRLMPMPDDMYSNTGDDTIYYENFNRGGHGTKNFDSSNPKVVIIIVSIGIALVLITVCMTWKACVECCTSSKKRLRHRAFIEQSKDVWKCEVCYHTNQFYQTECVLCSTPAEAMSILIDQEEGKGIVEAATSHAETKTRSNSNYQFMPSPHLSRIKDLEAFLSGQLTARQVVARERHKWKRSISARHVRWVNVPFEALHEINALRSTIIRERDIHEWHKWHPPQTARSSQMSLSSLLFSDNGGHQLSWLAPGPAFVCSNSQSGKRAMRLHFTEKLSTPSRKYSKTLRRVAALTFSEKVQWLHQYALKLFHSFLHKFHTVQIHRDEVLKQSMNFILSAPVATLHRRLRVDFIDEVGVDGGGILREWLHLICTQLFAEALGLFSRTNSTAHQGYWINRTTTKRRSTEQLQMYVFFGKLLGKAVVEGLVLNVRLSIPLLKHILGTPLELSDLYLLDETVHSSMMWILENDNTDTLGLSFMVEDTELLPSGADVFLHDGNKQLYVAKVAQYYLFQSVRAEISSIMEGVRSVISDTVLHIFDFKELDLVLSGLPQIDINDWRMHTDIRFYEQNKHESNLVDWFWEILESFTQDQRGRLLQYVTGSSGVPVEGFKGLTGMNGEIKLFTIQLGKELSTVYTVLPHASTCLNRLDLPLYSSKAELEQILSMIIEMDVTGFSSR